MKYVATYSVLLVACIQSHAQNTGEGQADVFPDTTIPFDTAWYNHLWDSLPQLEYSEEPTLSKYVTDTIDTWPWYGDSITPVIGTYTVTVSGPNPCVDPAHQSQIYGSAPLTVTFVDIPSDRTYPWVTSWEPFGSIGCWSIVDPYKSWYEINLFDTTQQHSSQIGFAATRAMELCTDPPSETPEPAKPVPVPRQPWYEAVLPSQRKNWISA